MRRWHAVFFVVALLAGGAPRPLRATEPARAAVVSVDPADWTPHVLDGDVLAVVEAGDRIVVGGSFSAVREAESSEALDRRALFAFDARTGAIDRAFAPDIEGRVEALALSSDGTALFVGGDFVAGSTRDLVKFDVAGGRIVEGFDAVVEGRSVQDLAVRRTRLFVGGAFSAIGGVPRQNLAAVDTTTGVLDPAVDLAFTDPRSGTSRIEKFDVTPDGARLVAIGNFTRVSGQERHQIAVVDVAADPARVADWHTGRYRDACSSAWDTYMRDVAISPDGTYFVVVTAGARAHPTLCDTAARWELSAQGRELEPTWVDYSGGDSFTGVAVTGGAVYVGGHQRWMNNPFPRGTSADARPGPGAVPRSGIAALDPQNGLPLSWNPGRRARGAGAYALVPTATGLWIGSDTEDFGGEYHARLAFCPLDGAARTFVAEPAALPGDLYTATRGGELMRRWFDGSSLGRGEVVAAPQDWSRVRGAFMVAGVLYLAWDDGRFDARPFDGSSFGPPEDVELYGLRASDFPVADLTGMFFADGRLYYTVAGEDDLFSRYFSPESRVVGAEEFVADRGGEAGTDWSRISGLTFASSRIYYSDSHGSLHQVEFGPSGPQPGTDALVAAPPEAPSGASLPGEIFMFVP